MVKYNIYLWEAPIKKHFEFLTTSPIKAYVNYQRYRDSRLILKNKKLPTDFSKEYFDITNSSPIKKCSVLMFPKFIQQFYWYGNLSSRKLVGVFVIFYMNRKSTFLENQLR